MNDVIKNAIATLRDAFRNDGAEGESVHLVCDELEKFTENQAPRSQRETTLRALTTNESVTMVFVGHLAEALALLDAARVETAEAHKSARVEVVAAYKTNALNFYAIARALGYDEPPEPTIEEMVEAIDYIRTEKIRLSGLCEPTKPYIDGFTIAASEIVEATANFMQAKQRGLYPGSQDDREEWDRGYDDAVCAHRLGHDVADMVKSEFYAPALFTLSRVVQELLAGTNTRVRPDPRVR